MSESSVSVVTAEGLAPKEVEAVTPKITTPRPKPTRQRNVTRDLKGVPGEVHDKLEVIADSLQERLGFRPTVPDVVAYLVHRWTE